MICSILGMCYQRAKQMLHTALPDRVVCREKEVAQVAKFVEDHVGKQVPGSLYISGAPGTGKTAVVSNMMKELKVLNKSNNTCPNVLSVLQIHYTVKFEIIRIYCI